MARLKFNTKLESRAHFGKSVVKSRVGAELVSKPHIRQEKSTTVGSAEEQGTFRDLFDQVMCGCRIGLQGLEHISDRRKVQLRNQGTRTVTWYSHPRTSVDGHLAMVICRNQATHSVSTSLPTWLPSLAGKLSGWRIKCCSHHCSATNGSHSHLWSYLPHARSAAARQAAIVTAGG